MTYIVRWTGFYPNNVMEFVTREAAKSYAETMKSLKHVSDVRIEEVA